MRAALLVVATAIAATSCFPQVTFVTRMRDTSSRPKPVLVWGRISPGPLSAQDNVRLEASSFFANVPVGSDWVEDRVTLVDGDPTLLDSPVYSMVGWLELDGRQTAGCSFFEGCAATDGDVVFSREVQKGYPTTFVVEFTE
jgi:hypothetical protein